MPNVEYRVTDQRDLDLIGPLWEKLRAHHAARARSPDQAEHFAHMTFDTRKKGLLEKARKGALHLYLALDSQRNQIIGYCVSTVSEDKQGEIESIFVEAGYRRQGVGGSLMQQTLKWMDSLRVASMTIEVASGNEEVLGFYGRYNFYPRTLVLHSSKPSRG